MGTLMTTTGLPGQGPVRVGIAINDTSAGILLANGITLALLARERTGEGQWVHTSLLEAQIFMLDCQASRYTMKGEVPKQERHFHPTSPGTGMFQTADGYINIAASGDNLWKKFCEVAGDKELASHPDFATVPLRAKNRAALIAHLNDLVRSKPSAYWVEQLNKAGVPCGPINTIDQVFADPQVKHLGIRRPVDHPKIGTFDIVGQPIHMSAFPQPERLRPTPDQGQHTDEVLRELGYDAAAIKELHGNQPSDRGRQTAEDQPQGVEQERQRRHGARFVADRPPGSSRRKPQGKFVPGTRCLRSDMKPPYSRTLHELLVEQAERHAQ